MSFKYLAYLFPVIPSVIVHLFPITLSNFMQFNETMLILSHFFSYFVHEFTGSQSFHRENSCVMDHNEGRHLTVLTHWKCKISYIRFCRWVPNYTLAVCVTCHLTAATILSVQQRGPISILLFHYYANHMLLLHNTACLQHGLLYAPTLRFPLLWVQVKNRNIASQYPLFWCPMRISNIFLWQWNRIFLVIILSLYQTVALP